MLTTDMLTTPKKTPGEPLTGRQICVGQGNLQPLIFAIDKLLFSGSLVFISFGFSLKGFCIFSCHTFIAESLSC